MNKGLSLRVNGSDSRVGVDVFIHSSRLLWDLVSSVESSLGASGTHRLKWFVQDLHKGSASVTWNADPTPALPYAPNDVTRTVYEGLQMLENGPAQPEAFSPSALKRAKSLGLIVLQGKAMVRVSIEDAALEISGQLAANVDQLLAARTTELGIIDGTLKLIGSQNRLHCNIYDRVTMHAVECPFSQEHLPALLEAFDSRVQVTGWIEYTASGIPLRILGIVDIHKVPKDQDLPTQDALLTKSINLLGEWTLEEWEAHRRV